MRSKCRWILFSKNHENRDFHWCLPPYLNKGNVNRRPAANNSTAVLWRFLKILWEGCWASIISGGNINKRWTTSPRDVGKAARKISSSWHVTREILSYLPRFFRGCWRWWIGCWRLHWRWFGSSRRPLGRAAIEGSDYLYKNAHGSNRRKEKI